ncbi:DUF2496 domain-containing protein [Thalassotalea maritima]|uniref:DUF2496 domain-containing protein n=1 Tax=Thalassotalea maritima TaxID=3242416 RepID=UPI0035272203
MSLDKAPKHIQLAVDLIQILEDNQVNEQVVLDALQIVINDYQHKLTIKQSKHEVTTNNDNDNK